MARENLNDAKAKPQRDRFIETARELECDEDESRFNETLKRIAPKKDDQDDPSEASSGHSPCGTISSR